MAVDKRIIIRGQYYKRHLISVNIDKNIIYYMTNETGEYYSFDGNIITQSSFDESYNDDHYFTKSLLFDDIMETYDYTIKVMDRIKEIMASIPYLPFENRERICYSYLLSDTIDLQIRILKHELKPNDDSITNAQNFYTTIRNLNLILGEDCEERLVKRLETVKKKINVFIGSMILNAIK